MMMTMMDEWLNMIPIIPSTMLNPDTFPRFLPDMACNRVKQRFINKWDLAWDSYIHKKYPSTHATRSFGHGGSRSRRVGNERTK